MNTKKSGFSWKFYGGLAALILASMLGGATYLAQGPDRELHFTREAHSTTQLPVLSAALQDAAQWPRWFHLLEKVTQRSPSGAETPAGASLKVGAQLKLYFDGHKSPWSHMEMTAQLIEIGPRKVTLRILTDSKNKITRLFRKLDWTVELQPETDSKSGAQGTLIRGSALAETQHWKSRLFGRVTERILMNQVYYPNLIEFAALKTLTQTGAPVRPSLSSSDALISIQSGK